LAKNETITFTYQAAVSPTTPYGTLGKQVSWIGYQDHGLIFDRVVVIPLNTPDWTSSTLTVSPTRVALNDGLTYTLRLLNTGSADAPLVTVTGVIPPHLLPLPITITQGTGSFGTIQLSDGTLTWQTPVTRNQVITLTFSAQVIAIPYPFTFPLTLSADDGSSSNNQWTVEAWVKPYPTHLPLIFKQ
jgi:uncharacterized repeat protein (TIGR01451 family)